MTSRLITPARLRVWSAAAQHAFFGVVPVVFTVWMWHFAASRHSLAIDFHNAFWPAGRHVLLGLTPYAGPHSSLAASGIAFVYPAVGALFFGVIALVPHGLADVLFTLSSIAAVIATLILLRIRDWRLYGLALLWPAVISGWQTANITLLLTCGVALAWRHRDRPAISGCIVAILVSLKVFLWPLLLWLLATKRLAGFAWAMASGILVNVLAWAVLGFHQAEAYVALARAVSRVEESTAYTPIALALHLGASRALAHTIGFGLAAGVALACLYYGRRRRDASALLLAIAVSLLATPTVWRHYFALLLVPVAIARPRVTAIWLLPLALFLCPVTTPLLWQLALALGIFACVVLVLLRTPNLMPRTSNEQSLAFRRILARSTARPLPASTS